MIGVTGCGSSEKKDASATATAVTRTAEQGPVAVTFTVAPTDLAMSDHAVVTIVVNADTGLTVSEPDYARALRESDHAFEYRVVHAQKERAKPAGDNRLTWTHRYEIEFVLPGEYELPAVEVSYADTRSPAPGASPVTDAKPKTETVTTEPIKVTVRATSAVATSPVDLQRIKRLDPVELPTAWDRWWWTAPLIALTVLVMMALLVRRSRRRRAETVVVIPAHEWARQRIAALISENLIGRGLVQEFYYRISDIVRGYIERRFDLSAPEMTSEEFLAATADDRRFGADMRLELNRFLIACDMVKYARYEPGREEPEAVLCAAGEFVERTRERPEEAAPVEERAA